MADSLRIQVTGPDGRASAVFFLGGQEAVLGRDASCDFVLAVPTVSARHGRFRVVAGDHVYEDLGSRNGSIIERPDGSRVVASPGEAVPIRAGDRIVLGSGDAPVFLMVEAAETPFAPGVGPLRTVVASHPLGDLAAPGPEPVVHLAAQVLQAQSPSDLAAAALRFLKACLPACEGHAVQVFARGFQVEAGDPIPGALATEARSLQEVTLLSFQAGNLPLTESIARTGVQAAVLAPLAAHDGHHGLLAAWSLSGLAAIPTRTMEPLGVAAVLLSLAAQAFANRLDDEEDRRRLEQEVAALRRGKPAPADVEPVGNHASFRAAVQLCGAVAASDVPVLILGETGTGKEVLARFIHRRSRRADGPFVAFNCAAVPESLMESELFGHVRGAFTGAASDRAGLLEAADHGTLFLDEIGEMPLAMQAKLLRVLEDGGVRRVGAVRPVQVNLRVVCATHRDLNALAAQGTFRSDLLFRLNTVVVRIPPLRERGADRLILAHHLLARACRRERKRIPGFTRDAMDLIERHPWPGNVRELDHEITRAVVLTPDGEPIRPDALSETLRAPGPAGPRTMEEVVQEAQREAVRSALARAGGQVARAARDLGLTRAGLYKLMERLGIEREQGRSGEDES